MKLGARLPSGVPTTPPPAKAAPNPRYNDLTRPRALQINTDPRQGRLNTFTVDRAAALGDKPQLQRQQEQRWSDVKAEKPHPSLRRSTDSCGLAGSDPFFFEQQQLLQQQLLQQRKSTSSSADPDFPLPWQGNIDLPASDEETMNAAQTWIAQILHENCEDGNDDDDIDLSSDVLLDGRVLCRVVKAITPGSVEVVHQDKSNNARNMYSFLIACRKVGVPAGALFDVDELDPRRVGLCLHVLSRVVRDTVPEFVGPFLSLPIGSSPTPTTDGDEAANNNLASLRQWPPPQDSAATPLSEHEEAETVQQQSYQHHRGQSRPPTPPSRPRPLSFPSRFSPATQANDAVWNDLFPPPVSQEAGGSGGGDGSDGGNFDNLRTDGDGEGRVAAEAWHATGVAAVGPTSRHEFSGSAAAAVAKLSTWLSNLNLGTFEDSLVNIGVQSMGDLRYVEEQDLRAIGMHGPQIRKLLQNRP